jgi:hypothetical protein
MAARRKNEGTAKYRAAPSPARSGSRTRRSLPVEPAQALQQTLGNQGVLRRMEAGLRVNDVNDPMEKEADRVAAAVIAASVGAPYAPTIATQPAARLQRKCESCLEEENLTLQRQADPPQAVSPFVSAGDVNGVLRGQNQPLPLPIRTEFETRFGRDFSDVRIHTDEPASTSAKSLGALAYTVGNHIVFAANKFAPHHRSGRELLAHELTHVIQNDVRQVTLGGRRSHPAQGPLEQQAKAAEGSLGAGARPVRPASAAPPIQCSPDPALGPALIQIREIPLIYADQESMHRVVKILVAHHIDGRNKENIDAVVATILDHFGAGAGRAIATLLLAGLERAKARIAAESAQTPSNDESVPAAKHAPLRLNKARDQHPSTRVDAAIEYTRRAVAYATDDPPQKEKALKMLGTVMTFMAPLVYEENIRKHFHGPSTLYATLIAQAGVGGVKALDGAIRTGMGREGGTWDYHFDEVKLSRQYLLLLADEGTPQIRNSLERGVNQAFNTSLAITGGVLLTMVGVGLLIEAAGATAITVGGRISAFIITNPVLAEKLAPLAVGTVLKIVSSGGIKEFLDQTATPEGALNAAYDVIDLYCSVPTSGGGPTRNVRIPVDVESVEPNGTVTVRVRSLATAANDNGTPPGGPPASPASGKNAGVANTKGVDANSLPRVTVPTTDAAANDTTLPSNVVPLPVRRPVAVAAGQDFNATDVDQSNAPQQGNQTVATAGRGGGGKAVVRRTTPTTVTASGGGGGSSRGGSGNPPPPTAAANANQRIVVGSDQPGGGIPYQDPDAGLTGGRSYVDQSGRPLLREYRPGPPASRGPVQGAISGPFNAQESNIVHGAHLQMRAQGGPDSPDVIVPAPASVNLVDMGAIEKDLRDMHALDQDIYVQVYTKYEGRQTIPYDITYRVFRLFEGQWKLLFVKSISVLH